MGLPGMGNILMEEVVSGDALTNKMDLGMMLDRADGSLPGALGV